MLQSQSSDGVLQEPSNALLSFQPPQITNKSIALDSQLLPKAATLVSRRFGEVLVEVRQFGLFRELAGRKMFQEENYDTT